MKVGSFVACVILGLNFLSLIAVHAQEAAPAARPEDVSSPSSVVKASYDAISGPAGQTLNLDRFRALFLPNAQLVSVRVKDGKAETHVMTLTEFTAMVSGMVGKNGHQERELAERIEIYGNIANVWSTYESRDNISDPHPHVTRGINSIQLFNDGKRWWMTGAQWQHESADVPIPAKYLSERH